MAKKREKLPLKIGGYAIGDEENQTSIDLAEIWIIADPKMLRKVAKHLKRCSRKKELKKWDHHHMNNHKHGTEVIVIRPDYMNPGFMNED